MKAALRRLSLAVLGASFLLSASAAENKAGESIAGIWLMAEVLPEACWQRCYVHFLRNALDHLSSKAGEDCLTELRWLYDRRDGTEARQHLAAWLERWQPKYPKLTAWVEEGIEETFTFYRLPQTRPPIC